MEEERTEEVDTVEEGKVEDSEEETEEGEEVEEDVDSEEGKEGVDLGSRNCTRSWRSQNKACLHNDMYPVGRFPLLVQL